MSFRLKTILGIGLIEAVLLTLLITTTLAYFKGASQKQLNDRVTTATTLFATASKDALLASDLASLESIVDAVISNPDIVFASVVDIDGRMLAQRGQDEILITPGEIAATIQDKDGDIFGSEIAIEVAGIVYGKVQIGFDRSRLRSFMLEAEQRAIFIAAVEIVLVALFSFFLGTYLTRQLSRLTEATNAIAAGDLGHQIQVKGNDEIAATTRAFNLMSKQIQSEVREQQLAQDQLRIARDAAEAANRAKTTFLANMSHELRTPLNSIIGFSQILEIDNPEDSQNLPMYQEIHAAGDHLLQLINQLLDLASIEAGKIKLDTQCVELSALVLECLQLIKPLQINYSIEFVNNIQKAAFVSADKLRLKQVLLNLLANALKYNRPSGKVFLQVAPVDKNFLRVDIRDTGIGISKKQQSNLFIPFGRLNEHKHSVDGSGVGLVISKELIELMGGRIGVESYPDQGSTFWVTLPLAEKPNLAMEVT
ncbi:MAG: HAMP domain-containing protein [Gammaproteobacteria bacterium]|nr:HAMP domain-containing protein [Gammaproteobacteria bacterium]